MVKTNSIKWLKIGSMAVKNIGSVLSVYEKIFPRDAKNAELLKEIKRKALNGFLPNPDSLEKLAYETNNTNLMILAAFIHREIARLLASIYYTERKYLKEVVGAYSEAMALLISYMVIKSGNNDVLQELLRTFSEFLLMSKEVDDDKIKSFVKVFESILSKIIIMT